MKKILLIVVFALTLTACGLQKARTTLDVNVNDNGFDSSTYAVPAGADITVNLTDNGAVGHVFAVLKQGEHVTPPYGPKDADKVMWQLIAYPGNPKSGTFTAPTEPGKYDIICIFPGHLEMGMKATLVVKEMNEPRRKRTGYRPLKSESTYKVSHAAERRGIGPSIEDR
jgi:plastocyanin